jgi:hypothetical protein
MALDTGGNVVVDFVWGNHPMQPNDIRTEEAAVNIGGTTGSNLEAFQSATVTAASGNGTTVTYTAANSFNVGQKVTITGLATSALNLSNVFIASLVGTEGARTGFTVTNAASGSDSAQTALAKVVIDRLPGVGADVSWSATTVVTGERLNAALDNHANAEAGWSGYPSYTPGAANYMVTAASGDGTTVTYTAQNELAVGATVNITGLTASAYNLSSATVATANAYKFTVTNSANAGEITGQRGKVEATNALTAYDGAGIGNINVPSVVGDTTAVALDKLKDAGYETASITTATAATNLRTDVTRFNATSTTAATIYATSANTNYPVGTKVTLVAGTPAGVSPVNLPAYAIGTFTVTAVASGQITVSGTGFTVADTTGINSTLNLAGLAGTIKSQSVAAGTASVASTATITVTPYAAATTS